MAQPRYHDDPFEKATIALDEQENIENVDPSLKPPRKPKNQFKVLFIFAFIVYGMFYWIFAKKTYQAQQSRRPRMKDVEGEFENIVPSEKLEWNLCGDEWQFLCARLTVPMDYNRPLNVSPHFPKVHIALLMAPGGRSHQGEFSHSPFLINPGGPGGSGTWFATLIAKYIQIIVGAEQDVVGFDPRGIAATTPRADCFSDPLQHSEPGAEYGFGDVDYLGGFYKRMSWLVAGTSIGLINSSAVALSKLDVRGRTLGKLCAQKDWLHGENSIYRHIQTPNVARDMISIIDAWDEWRESGFLITDSAYNRKYANDDLTSGGLHAPFNTKPAEDVVDSKYSLDTNGKLLYWGFSYGTLLGATFAAMFPDRVGRVVLDGVIDADYYVEPVWSKSIVDTDPILDSFPKYCFEGKENCSLHRPGDSYEDIKSRFHDAQEKLRENPISFVGPTSHYPFILTIDDVRTVLFSALYAPNTMFGIVAILLDAVLEENYYVLETMYTLAKKEAFCFAQPESSYPTDAQMAIVCGDKRYPLNETTAELQTRFEKLSHSSSFADVWLSLMMTCNKWPIPQVDPPLRWGRHPAHSSKPINTSFPLLFLSNTYDPVTPLSAAVKMSKRFTDAGLLEQKAMGHCTLASVSACTMGVVRAYFMEGKVPLHPLGEVGMEGGKWEKCEADEIPFSPYESAFAKGDVRGEGGEEEMRWAAKEMQRLVGEHGFFQHDHGSGKGDMMPKLQRLNTKCGANKGDK